MTDEKRPLKVFLCHAHDDKPKARELYRYLKRRRLQPWLDAEDLLPGQNWQVEIPKALETSDAIIICLSKGSVDKEGYFQKEIKFALDKALEMPEGHILPIPARLDECEVPRSHLSTYQWVDLFDDGGHEKLVKALKARAAQVERSGVQILKIGDESPTPPEKSKSNVIAAIPETGVVPSSSIRLKQALELINGTKNTLERITIPRVAQLLGFSVTHEVEACFEGKAEASVSFLENFANFFGVNKQWLQFGEGHPFETEEKMQMQPLDYFERIRLLEPNEIIFVREDSGYGRTVILLNISEYKSTYFPSEFHVSSQIGGTGRHQLIGLYRLMTKVEEDGFPYSSRQVLKKDFDKLVEGEIYPSQIVSFLPNYWATDFLSPDFDENGAEQYDSELWKAYKIIEKEVKPVVQPVPKKPVESKLFVAQPKNEPRVGIPKLTPKTFHSRPAPPLFTLSAERQLDVLGVFLALGGLVIALALFSVSRSSITGTLLNVLDFLFGYGAYILPVALIGFGVWLVIRKIDLMPPISWKRISGIILLFLLLQTALHGLTDYGGWVGSLFYSVLYKYLGIAGTLTVMIAWGIWGLSLVFKTSVVELLSKLNFTQKPQKKPKNH